MARFASIELPDPALPGFEVSPESRPYLGERPDMATLELGDADEMLALHGSPRSADEIISATTPDDELDVVLDGVTASERRITHISSQIDRVDRWGLPGPGRGWSRRINQSMSNSG